MGDENKHIMIPAPDCGDEPVRLTGSSLWLAQRDVLVGQVADLTAERDALRAEVERLRAACKAMLAALDHEGLGDRLAGRLTDAKSAMRAAVAKAEAGHRG